MTTLMLTYEQREKLAHKYGLAGPDALTADDIVSGERLFAERRRDRDAETAYLQMLGIDDPEEREFDEPPSKSEREWREYAAQLNITNPA